MLIRQGGRDEQATIDDDLALWQSGLSSRPDITIHIYPVDTHFFFSGDGSSTPAEYEPAQHLHEAVVDDIALWPAALRESPS